MPTTDQKAKIVSEFGANAKDTGATSVQIALQTERINELTGHLKTHKKDLHSERGLVLLVSKRRKLLDYLKRTDEKAYQDLIKKLKIRK
jgi:small subunit ribosomal protein S15